MTVADRFAQLIRDAQLVWPQLNGRVRLMHGQASLWYGLNQGGSSDFEVVVQMEITGRASIRLHVGDRTIDRRAVLDALGQVLPFVRKFLEQIEVDLALGAIVFEDRAAWKLAALRFSPMRALGAPSTTEQGEEKP